MINLFIVESGLELIPRKIWKHPTIIRYCKKRKKPPNKILLDISFHYDAMQKLKDWYKRGRPDIVHICLLEALSSPLNLNGFLRIFIHTFDEKIIFINPKIRLPRNYNRFTGLMAQLLYDGKIPPRNKEKLMWIEKIDLDDLFRKYRPTYTIVFDENGIYKNIFNFITNLSTEKIENMFLIIGGFQRGKLSRKFHEKADEIISIYKHSLDAWIVVSRILCALEIRLNIY